MYPFYLLLALTVLMLANLLLSLWPTSGRSPAAHLPIERRRALLDAREIRALHGFEQAVGETRRVQPGVPLRRLIRPAPGVSTWRARSWLASLGNLSVDLAVLSADGSEPLCAILLTTSGKASRQHRREQTLVQTLCKAANLPVLTYSEPDTTASEWPSEALKARIEELIGPLEVSLSAQQALASEDEDALLASLAVAMQDRSVATRTPGR